MHMKRIDEPGRYLAVHPALNLDVDAGIAVLTINRPEKRNALTLELWRNIGSIFTSLGERSDIRVIVLTGTGARLQRWSGYFRVR